MYCHSSVALSQRHNAANVAVRTCEAHTVSRLELLHSRRPHPSKSMREAHRLSGPSHESAKIGRKHRPVSARLTHIQYTSDSIDRSRAENPSGRLQLRTRTVLGNARGRWGRGPALAHGCPPRTGGVAGGGCSVFGRLTRTHGTCIVLTITTNSQPLRWQAPCRS
jgi:hypothetical protein